MRHYINTQLFRNNNLKHWLMHRRSALAHEVPINYGKEQDDFGGFSTLRGLPERTVTLAASLAG